MSGKRNLKRAKATMTPTQLRAELRERAMPQVKQLVKKFDRQTVGWCLNQLAEYERKVKRLKQAKKEVEQMESELD